MRKIKNLPLLIMLGTLALTSVGFSVYVSDDQASSGFETTIDVGATINYSEACSFDTTKGDNNSGITTLKVCKDGFVDTNNVCKIDGEMKIYLKLNANYFKQHFVYDPSLKNMQIEFSLNFGNYSSTSSPVLFLDGSTKFCSLSIMCGPVSFDDSSNKTLSVTNTNYSSLGVTHFLKASESWNSYFEYSYTTIYLLLIYKFSYEPGYNFESNIYNRVIAEGGSSYSKLNFGASFIL